MGVGDPAGDGGLLDDLPVFDAEGWLEELELGSDPGAASLGYLVQVHHRRPTNQLRAIQIYKSINQLINQTKLTVSSGERTLRTYKI